MPSRSTKNGWPNVTEFRARVQEWSDRMAVKPARVQLQPMKNKWGSCSAGGRVTFNSDLLREDRAFGEYVIVHELLHVRVPNHGKLFKSLLKAYFPEWKQVADGRKVCGAGDPSGPGLRG